jgi:uncharacterized phage infection (PIP) family protein YhgE
MTFLQENPPMTTERWTDTALDRLVQTVASIAELTEQNTRDISGLKVSVERLANISEQHQQSLEQHQQMFTQHQQMFVQHQENFDRVVGEIQEMQSEVRGLQTENRRILDQLINRNDNNE